MKEFCSACKVVLDNKPRVHLSCYNEVLVKSQEKIKEPIKSVIDIELSKLKEEFWEKFQEFKDYNCEFSVDENKILEELRDIFYNILETKKIREPITEMLVMYPILRTERPNYLKGTQLSATYHFAFSEEDRDNIKQSLEGWLGRVFSNNTFGYILENLVDYFYNTGNLMINNIWITHRLKEELEKGNYHLIDKL